MAKNSVEILIRARDGATQSLKAVRDSVKAVGTEARAGVRPLKEYRDELAHQVTELDRVAKSMDKTTDEYAAAVDELARVKGELKSVNTELENQDTSWTKLGSRMTTFGAKMSLGVTAPLTALAGAGIASAMQLETFSTQLEVLIGDTERAAAVFEELYEFSANVPFDWRTISEGTRILSAFGTEAEDTVATLSSLGDIAAGTGSDLTGLAEIYGRVAVTGRVSMQEVNSLALRGVPIYQELAAVIGASTEEVREMVSAGTIGFPELQQVIQNLTTEGGKFAGMMEAQADTVAGRLARLKDSFEQILDIIGEHLLPMFDAMIGYAQQAVEWFVNLDESTQGLFVGLGIALAAGGPLLVGVGTLLVQLPRLTAAFQALRTSLALLAGPGGAIALGVAAVISLTMAMAGREGEKKGSLLGAMEDTAAAAASIEDPVGRASSAFDTLADGLRGKALEAFLSVRGELAAIVAEADNAAQALLQIQLGSQLTSLFGTTFGNVNVRAALNAAGASMYGSARIRGAEAQVTSYLQRGQFDDAVAFLDQVIAVLESGGAIATNALAEVQDFRELVAQARELSQKAFARGPASVAGVSPVYTPSVTVPVEVEITGDGSELLTDPDAARGFITRLVDQLAAGLESARDGWRDALTNFGVITGTLLRDAFGVDQPDSDLVVLGREIVTAIGDGIEAAFPSLGDRLAAGLTAVKNKLADDALAAWVISGGALAIPESTYTAPTASPYVPDIIGVGGRPAPRDVAGLESNIAQMSEAMFGPRSAAGRFLVDLSALFATASREIARADRIAAYELRAGYERGQEARFGSPEARAAYSDRVINDPRSAGFRRDIPVPAPYAVTPPGRDLSFNPTAHVSPARDLTFNPTAQVMPDRSHLTADQRDQILDQEMEARRALINQLTTMSTENSPLANFGTQLLAAAAEQIPAFGAALDGFIQAGPVGAIIGFFTDLLLASEPMKDGFLAINEALAPLGEILGRVIAPALQLLAIVIGGVVDALVAVYNFLLGWIPGMRIERPGPVEKDPRVFEHSDAPPASREMDFGRVSPGVQLAVATPLLEAAQLSLAAAQLQTAAANSLLSVVTRMEAMYARVLSEGFRVVLETPADAGTSSQTAYLR